MAVQLPQPFRLRHGGQHDLGVDHQHERVVFRSLMRHDGLLLLQ